MDFYLPPRVQQEYERLQKERTSTAVHPKQEGRRGTYFRPGYMPSASTPGADWKPGDSPSFALLRLIARRSVFDSLIIDARRRQIKKVARRAITAGKDIGIRVVHKRYDDPAFRPDESLQTTCRMIEDVIERVNPSQNQQRLKDVMAMWTEDELIIDRKVMVLTRNRLGQVIYYHYLDGATILPRISVLYPWMEKTKIFDEQKAATALSYKYNIDINNAAYVQEVEGQLVAAWRKDQISIDIANPVGEIDHILYGRSALERSLELTRATINAWRYNQNLFDVRYPDSILILLGEYTQDELDNFRDQMTQGDTGNNQRMPVFSQPLDPLNPQQRFAENIKVRDTPREMQFPDLLRMAAALKCAAYGMHPSTINFAPDGGGATPVISNVDEEKEIENAEEDGLGSLISGFCDWFTDVIVKPYDPDLKVIVDGLNQQAEQARIEVLSERTWTALNETRAKDDMQPWQPPKGMEPDLAKVLTEAADVPRDPGYLQAVQMIQGAAQMAQQAQMQQQMPGQDGGDYGKEDAQEEGGDDSWWQQQAQQHQQPGQPQGQPGQPQQPQQPGPPKPPPGAQPQPNRAQ